MCAFHQEDRVAVEIAIDLKFFDRGVRITSGTFRGTDSLANEDFSESQMKSLVRGEYPQQLFPGGTIHTFIWISCLPYNVVLARYMMYPKGTTSVLIEIALASVNSRAVIQKGRL